VAAVLTPFTRLGRLLLVLLLLLRRRDKARWLQQICEGWMLTASVKQTHWGWFVRCLMVLLMRIAHSR
jgi:hypothetical protein